MDSIKQSQLLKQENEQHKVRPTKIKKNEQYKVSSTGIKNEWHKVRSTKVRKNEQRKVRSVESLLVTQSLVKSGR